MRQSDLLMVGWGEQKMGCSLPLPSLFMASGVLGEGERGIQGTIYKYT